MTFSNYHDYAQDLFCKIDEILDGASAYKTVHMNVMFQPISGNSLSLVFYKQKGQTELNIQEIPQSTLLVAPREITIDEFRATYNKFKNNKILYSMKKALPSENKSVDIMVTMLSYRKLGEQTRSQCMAFVGLENEVAAEKFCSALPDTSTLVLEAERPFNNGRQNEWTDTVGFKAPTDPEIIQTYSVVG